MAITARHESSHPRGRARHPVPPRDEGDAQGDAARRRQAGHPVRGRGGRRRRAPRCAHDHRPQQERAREPLRPRDRARGRPSSRRATPTGSRRSTTPPTSPTCTTCARATRRASATRCSAPRCTSATSRSPCSSATTSSTSRDALLSADARGAAAARTPRVVALLEVDPDSIHLYGAATVERDRRRRRGAITGLVEKPDQENAPSNYAIIGRYVLQPEIFDVLEQHRAGQGRRDPADRRAAGAGRRRRTGPAACTASSSAAAATTPATGSTTSRRSCSSPSTATTSAPSCGRGSRSSRRALDARREGACRHPTIPTLSEGTSTIRPDPAPRCDAPLERELLENRSWLRQWEATNPVRADVVRHAGEHPVAAGERARRSRPAVRHRVRRRARRPAQRLVDHLRLAVVGDHRLLGLGAVRGSQHHADGGRARHRLLLLPAAACTAWRSASGPRTRRACGWSRSSASATRDCAGGTSTSTATGATTSASRLVVEELPQGVLRRWLDGQAPTDVADRSRRRTAPPRRCPSRSCATASAAVAGPARSPVCVNRRAAVGDTPARLTGTGCAAPYRRGMTGDVMGGGVVVRHRRCALAGLPHPVLAAPPGVPRDRAQRRPAAADAAHPRRDQRAAG